MVNMVNMVVMVIMVTVVYMVILGVIFSAIFSSVTHRFESWSPALLAVVDASLTCIDSVMSTQLSSLLLSYYFHEIR